MKKMIGLLLIAISLNLSAPIPDNVYLLQQVIEILEKRDREILIQRAYSEPFSEELFYEALRVYVRYPDIVYRQAILETGWFKSKSFLIGNNFAGMKLPKTRKTTATGEYLGHAKYKHWLDCVIDYKYYQEYYDSIGYNLSDYYNFLTEAGYSTSRNYINVLKTL